LGDFFAIVINALMGGLFALSFIAVAVGFLGYITSKGDPKATDKASKTVTWGIIGIVISFGVLVAKTIVINILGIEGEIKEYVPTSI